MHAIHSQPSVLFRTGKEGTRTGRGPVTKLNHLAEGDTGGGEAGIMPDGFHQAL